MPVAKTKSTKLSGKRRAVKREYKNWRDTQQGLDLLTTRQKTYHEGANDERSAVLAKIRRMKKECEGILTITAILDSIEQWLLQRNERYKNNPGGL